MPYSAKAADRAVNFFGRALVHTKGQWAGQKFDLLAWQRDRVVCPLFGTLNADGLRQYRTCYVEVPRKNGKSTLAGGIALYMLLADGEMGAEVYGAAGDREQASIVYRSAAEMVRQSPVLAERLKVIDSTKRIIDYKTGSFYRAIPAEAHGAHGFNASCVVVDEVHVQPNRDLIDVLTTSVGARRQPLIFYITTAGFDRNSICYELHNYAKKVESGIVEDATFLPVLYGAEETDDWNDPHVWAKANPSLGETITGDFLEIEARKAAEVPGYQNTFRRLYLNQWTSQDTRWLDMAAWDRCADRIDLDALKGRPCYAGLDLASTTDIAALVLAFPIDQETESEKSEPMTDQSDEESTESEPLPNLAYALLPFFFIPGDNVAARVRRDRVPYDVWIREGLLTATEGNVIDYRTIEAKIDELAQLYDIREIGFDRWGATQLVQDLGERGLDVVPIGQGFASMSAPTKELLNLILSRRIRHGGHPILRWMADNVRVEMDAAGNLKPSKAKSTQRIDGIVASIMALDRAIRNEKAPGVYEDRGLLVI